MLAARSPQQESISDIEVEMNSTVGPACSVSPHGPVEEEGEVSYHEADIAPSEADQLLYEEQSYREMVRGICSYMGWHQSLTVHSLQRTTTLLLGPDLN